MSRHYAAFIEFNAAHPSVTKILKAQVTALQKDPACIIVTNAREVFAARSLDMPVVQSVYDGVDRQFLMCLVDTYDGVRVTPLSYASPWGLNPTHTIAGFRSMLTDEDRKGLVNVAG